MLPLVFIYASETNSNLLQRCSPTPYKTRGIYNKLQGLILVFLLGVCALLARLPTCSFPRRASPSRSPQPAGRCGAFKQQRGARRARLRGCRSGEGSLPGSARHPALPGSDPHLFHLAPTPQDPSRGGRPRGGRCCLIRPRGNNQTHPPPSPSPPPPPPPPRLPGHLQNPGWVPAAGSPRGRCLPARSDGGGGARGRRGRRAAEPPGRLCGSARAGGACPHRPAPPRTAQRPRPPSPRRARGGWAAPEREQPGSCRRFPAADLAPGAGSRRCGAGGGPAEPLA